MFSQRLRFIRALRRGWLLLLTALSSFGVACQAQSMLGFNLSNATIPVDEIHRGGPPPDGIPAIDEPNFTKAGEVDFLEDGDVVLGFVHGGEARAYPFRILIWHEIVNDTVAGTPVAPTYCPLCGTAMVFGREYGGQVLDFGVSGLLYNSDVLMFDRQTSSLWSQLGLKAVSGDYAGTGLEWLPSEQMTWEAWRERYPDSDVLNLDTGHRRDYLNLPYQSYFHSPRTMFPYQKHRDDMDAKVWVAGVRHGGSQKAYPLESLPSGQAIEDTIGGKPVSLRYDREAEHFQINDAEGDPLPVVHAFWFAWQAFFPETELWESSLNQ